MKLIYVLVFLELVFLMLNWVLVFLELVFLMLKFVLVFVELIVVVMLNSDFLEFHNKNQDWKYCFRKGGMLGIEEQNHLNRLIVLCFLLKISFGIKH